MRRPSIPFEAIGLGARAERAALLLNELAARQKRKETMTQPDPTEPVVPPTDPVEPTPTPTEPTNFEDDDEELEVEDEDDEEEE